MMYIALDMSVMTANARDLLSDILKIFKGLSSRVVRRANVFVPSALFISCTGLKKWIDQTD